MCRGNDREWTLSSGEVERFLQKGAGEHFEAGSWGNEQLGFDLLAKLQLPLDQLTVHRPSLRRASRDWPMAIDAGDPEPQSILEYNLNKVEPGAMNLMLVAVWVK